MTTISIDISPALEALGTTPQGAALPVQMHEPPSGDAVSAFQAAIAQQPFAGVPGGLSALVTENAGLQTALEAAVAKPLVVPQAAVPQTDQAVSVAVPQTVIPAGEVAARFTEQIAPLVTENAGLQETLEAAVAKPLVLPQVTVPQTEVPQAEVPQAAVPQMAKAKVVDEIEVPEASAEALVAAGVAPSVSAPVAPASAEVAPVGVVTSAAPTREISQSEVLIAAAESVAETILVTPGLLKGDGEIRVQLKPDVLAGTEIQLSVTGRSIEVSFLPQTQDMGVLIERCLPQLEQHLAERVHAFAISAKVGRKSTRRVGGTEV